MGGATIKDEMKFMSKIGLRLRKKKTLAPSVDLVSIVLNTFSLFYKKIVDLISLQKLLIFIS